MPVTISFELSDRDIEHFIAMAREAHEAVAEREDALEHIAAGAREVFEAAHGAELPEFIAARLAKLAVLADMVTDAEWALPEDDRERVLSAMAYFANPDDLIPDRVPGIGFLDDAIMAELVIEGLASEIEAYQEFCSYREAEGARRAAEGVPGNATRDDWLADKRAALYSQMRQRRRSRRAAGGWRTKIW